MEEIKDYNWSGVSETDAESFRLTVAPDPPAKGK